MSQSVSPQQTKWQPGRVPKLSYRKPIPQDELDNISHPPREYVAPTKTMARTSSVHKVNDVPMTTTSVQTPSKKKNSFLSGFFTKEPTLLALAQVEADLTAKHGAANPESVPHVSSRKMPQHVPKVNSRWDGVPETVKVREREDRQRKRLSQRSSHDPPSQSVRTRSSNGSLNGLDSLQPRSRRESDAASNADSWQSQHETSRELPRSGSFSSMASSNDSRGSRTFRSAPSQFSRQTPIPAIPEMTSYFPQNKKQTTNKTSGRQQIANNVQSDAHPTPAKPNAIDRIPEHSSSPAATPREMSPTTPVSHASKEVSTRVVASNTDKICASSGAASSNRVKHVPIDAFLAGEAQLLELKGDPTDAIRYASVQSRQPSKDPIVSGSNAPSRSYSARGRSGIRANGVVRSEAAPWEVQAPPPTVLSGTVAPRTRVIRKH